MPTNATRAAYAELDRVELLDDSISLEDLRFSLPNTSMLAAYLDDFLPGNQSQWLHAKLKREGENWLLGIDVDTLDETGYFRFTARGDFAR